MNREGDAPRDGLEAEGVIKFRCEWLDEPLSLDLDAVEDLFRWRDALWERELVGALPDGIGYGNLSVRLEEAGREAFLITGSGTGGMPKLSVDHLAVVTEYSTERNWLRCRGGTRASSESLTHAAIYEGCPHVVGVIHIHSSALWNRHLGKLPTTPQGIEYGTPEMAAALHDLAVEIDPERPGVVVMGGHPDGLMVFGTDLDAAGSRVLALAGLQPLA
jgi:L-ribulose-5-phosphate 4-epimerase